MLVTPWLRSLLARCGLSPRRRRHQRRAGALLRRGWSAEVLEDRCLLSILGDFDPLAALPDPVVSIAAITTEGVVTQNRNDEINDGWSLSGAINLDQDDL